MCNEHNARISPCAWNTFYLHFAYLWMLWYGKKISWNNQPPLNPTTENVMTWRWKCTCFDILMRGMLIGWTETKEGHLIGPCPCPTITIFGRCHYRPGTRTHTYLFLMQKANALISGLFSLIIVITFAGNSNISKAEILNYWRRFRESVKC